MLPVVVSLLALGQMPAPDVPPVPPTLIPPSAPSVPPVPPVPLGPPVPLLPPGPPPINLSHPAPPLIPPATPAVAAPPPDPSWAAQLPCPAPAAHPFQRLPRICYLKACECDGSAGGAPNPVYWVKEFHEAAHVPLPRFTIDGQAVCQDGLLIYEGMRVTVYTTGVYDVSFTAEVPNMPVTLRLQLVLKASEDPTTWYRLTLPPFRLEPKADAAPGDPSANIFHVSHRGYSSLLVREGHLGPCHHPRMAQARVGPDWAVARVGTARFGTPVAIADPTR